MEEYNKVFSSKLERAEITIENNLYDLINVVPATPCKITKTEEISCDFRPRYGKQYQPKKPSKLKVKTVRDIRRIFEQDELSYLHPEIEKQQDYLLKKIKAGSSRDTQTKAIAKKLMTCDKPLSRSALQMLMTINPHDHTHHKQYVVYKGKRIRVNGSTGGEKPNLSSSDLSKKIVLCRKRPQFKHTKVIGKKGLLRNSLAVKFKPGPLIKKINLDDSYQKYNVGTTELVHIPKAGLCLQPTLGVILEPSIMNIVQNLRDEDGTISEKWAEFSVSVLSTASSSNLVQNDTESYVTFDLNYKFDQKKILMRRDINSICSESETINDKPILKNEDYSEIEIKTMLSKMLDSVEISLLQDEIYTKEIEPVLNYVEDCKITNGNTTHAKEKKKKRYVDELGKLDVTVIRLPDKEFEEKNELCQNSFCSLGCICPSLQNPCNIKQHCGLIECMFKCKCDFSKYAIDTLKDTGLLPGIINLDNEINLKLTKEEQKFHQTVVFSGNQSIVLKSEKRACKASNRYADFYTEMSLRTDEKLQQDVSVVLVKLDCEGVKPWCMVHKLYKCFCKGKFTDAALMNDLDVHTKTEYCPEEIAANTDVSRNRKRSACSYDDSRSIYINDSSEGTEVESDIYKSHSRCARAMIYYRKHMNSYYLQMNSKIIEMEKNDDSLRKKMQQLVNSMLTDMKNCMSVSKIQREQESVNKVSPNDEGVLDRQNNPPVQKDCYKQVKKSKRIHEKALHEVGRGQIDLEVSKSTEHMEKQQAKLHTNKEMPKVVDDYESQIDLLKTKSVEEIEKKSTKLINLDNIPRHSTQREPDRAKLIVWLESSYQQYKKREQQGKIVLEPPKNKKLVIYAWSFIISRYNEKKNVFLVTRNMPYRLFMAVETTNSFFKNCVNLESIRMADLNKYPVAVQKLITGAPIGVDNFCILCGLHCCWEFVGSVSKVGDRMPNYSAISDSAQNTKNQFVCSDDSDIHMNVDTFDDSDIHMNVDTNESDDSKKYLKWFVMTIEEDFSEIQFSLKGFFVKYESIVKAVEVARLSGKTVRLSSQKNSNQDIDPQFGIYAVPRTDEYCAFIGPYQTEECLGIDIIKSNKYLPKASKGFWITNETGDTYKVIDNPLSFLPLTTDSIEYFTLTNKPLIPIPSTNNEHSSKEADTINNIEGDKTQSVAFVNTSSVKEKQVVCKKTIKPIKIRNTAGIYHLMPKGFFTNSRCSKASRNIQSSNSLLLQPFASSVADHPKITLPMYLNSSNVNLAPSSEIKKPIAEIAPQIKIVDVYSESTTQLPNQNTGRGMFILKPEEINKRVLKNVSVSIKSPTSNDTSRTSDQQLDQDIENFLATSNICIPPNVDAFMDSVDKQIASETNLKDVFIESNTIENLGWIQGQRNADNDLSFRFPGFVYTQFYPEPEAFSKINQVLSRKVYVPPNLILKWQVAESEDQLKCKHILSQAQLGQDFVLTKLGLRHKRDIITYGQTIKSFSKQLASGTISPPAAATVAADSDGALIKAIDLLNEQEDESQEIDQRNDALLQEIVAASNSEISSSIFGETINSQREKVAERLQDILSSATLHIDPD